MVKLDRVESLLIGLHACSGAYYPCMYSASEDMKAVSSEGPILTGKGALLHDRRQTQRMAVPTKNIKSLVDRMIK